MASQESIVPMRTTTVAYDKSKEFMDALNKLLGIVDDVAQSMTEKQYVDASKAMKDLYDNRVTMIKTIRESAVVVEHTRRVRRAQAPRNYLTKEQRVLSGRCYRCSKCDRQIVATDDSDVNMVAHKKRDICNDIYASKRLSVLCGTTNIQDHNKKIQKYLKVINAIRSWSKKVGKGWEL